MGHVQKECANYRKALCNMGYAPPDHINDPDGITRYYRAVMRVAPMHCFHCLGEGHMKPNCPHLKRSTCAQAMGAAPAAQAATPTVGGTNQYNMQGETQTTPLTREEINAAMKQQIDGMEQRMLEAVRKMLNPTKNNPNMNRGNQATAVSRGNQAKAVSRGNQAKAVRSSADLNAET